MIRKLNVVFYLLLMLINSLIGFQSSYSWGMLSQTDTNEKLMLNIRTLNLNKNKIYDYVKINCTELIHAYPEFLDFRQINICWERNGPLLLGKISILLSTLYNTYLPYALYGPPIMPILVMFIACSILWSTSFIEDPWTITAIEFSSIIAGYVMIITQCLIAHVDNRLTPSTEKKNESSTFTTTNNDQHYDNLPMNENMMKID